MQGNCSDDEDELEDDPERVVEAELELVHHKLVQPLIYLLINPFNGRFTFPQGYFEQSGQWTLQTGAWQMMLIVGSFNLSRYGEGYVGEGGRAYYTVVWLQHSYLPLIQVFTVSHCTL